MLIKTGNCFHTLAQFVIVKSWPKYKIVGWSTQIIRHNARNNERKLTFSDSDVYLIQFPLRSKSVLQ